MCHHESLRLSGTLRLTKDFAQVSRSNALAAPQQGELLTLSPFKATSITTYQYRSTEPGLSRAGSCMVFHSCCGLKHHLQVGTGLYFILNYSLPNFVVKLPDSMNQKRLSTLDHLDGDSCWTHEANDHAVPLYDMPNTVMIELQLLSTGLATRPVCPKYTDVSVMGVDAVPTPQPSQIFT